MVFIVLKGYFYLLTRKYEIKWSLNLPSSILFSFYLKASKIGFRFDSHIFNRSYNFVLFLFDCLPLWSYYKFIYLKFLFFKRTTAKQKSQIVDNRVRKCNSFLICNLFSSRKYEMQKEHLLTLQFCNIIVIHLLETFKINQNETTLFICLDIEF